MNEKRNKTVFYIGEFASKINECDGIIQLNNGDCFLGTDKKTYKVIWKFFNPSSVTMTYKGVEIK